MELRKYRSSDAKALAQLFCQTVRAINAGDYTKQQLDAWTAGAQDLEAWDLSFQAHESVVAVEEDRIIGFGDIDKTGLLDRLYVHKDYQGQGTATAICDYLEQAAPGRIYTHASITARPFFERRGYRTVKEQQVQRQGLFLTNFLMEKTLEGSRIRIEVLRPEFSVCMVEDYSQTDLEGEFCFPGKTDGERSLVCPTEAVPDNAAAREDGWRAFRVQGPLDFSLIGILAGISSVLAEQRIGIFVVSTYCTDYIFTKTEHFSRALDALSQAGYAIV